MAATPPSCRSLTLLLGLSGAMLQAGCTGETPAPEIAEARDQPCVEEAETMRRDHPRILAQEKAAAVVDGRRTPERGLRGCVECHGDSEDTPVRLEPAEPQFCASCHQYAGVSNNCFECHSSRPDGSEVRHRLGQHHVFSPATQAWSGFTDGLLHEVLAMEEMEQ